MMKDIIKKVTAVYSPSGREDAIAEAIIEEIKDYVDEFRIDPIGNLIAVKKGTSGKTILFDGHMDEIGFAVTHHTDEGFLKFDSVGGINPYTLPGCRVQFNDRIGVFGVEGETSDETMNNYKNLDVANMFVDMGFSSREEAEEKAPIGTIGTYVSEFHDLGDRVVCKAMDDRIACAIMIDAIKNLKDNKHTVIFVFAVQEEVGLIGANVAAYDYDVDMAVAIDVTFAADTPKTLKRMSMEMGKGPCIKIKDAMSISDRPFVEFARDTAEKYNIPYQYEVLIFGGTDAYGYQVTKTGIPSGTISIASRYIHSPNEMVSVSDAENISKLLQAMTREDF